MVFDCTWWHIILFFSLALNLDVGINVFSGVRIEIINRDSLAMQDVSVEVTGASYQIGDIPSGSSKSVKVRSRGASAVMINYSDIAGEQHHVYIGTYIESGYFSHIKAQIKDGKILHIEQDLKVTPSF